MKIAFAGTPRNAAETLLALHEMGYEISVVITRLDAPTGRKRLMTPSPVAQVAEALNIPVVKTNRVDDSALGEISKFGADLGVIVAYGALLNRKALDALPLGWVNLHYSLLPSWRGAAPVQHALLNRDSITGVTIFQLDEGMDTGPIFSQVPTEINPNENARDLLERLTKLGVSALGETLPAIFSGLAKPIAQDLSKLDIYPLATKLSRQSARIDWSAHSSNVDAVIRAMNPEPMAWTEFGSDSIRILAARPYSVGTTDSTPGSIFSSDAAIVVACGDSSALAIIEVQPAGKKAMSASDWYRGLPKNTKVVFA